jgi:hypothetical protein
MTIYYLMVKTHTITGLKYLCQTKKKDPHKYLGSGKHWLLHLNKHGKTIFTEIIRECQSKDELKKWGLHYSELWNVTESVEWANLMEENGGGGKTTEEAWNKGKPSTPAMIQKMKDAILRRTDDTKEKMILSGKRSYEKTFALLTKEQRHEKYMNGLGKLTAAERRANGSIKGKKGGEKWSKASSGKVTVTTKLGNSKRVSQDLFNQMKNDMIINNVPMTDWEFVQVSSLESKRRRNNGN